MDNYFKKAGDLETSGQEYFYTPGDLDSVPSKNGLRMPNESDLDASTVMSRNGFERAGDLETSGQEYFYTPGDLDSISSKNGFRMPNENDLDAGILTSTTGFEKAGDLETSKQNYFRPAGDLEVLTEEAIKDYLITIVSGKKYNYGNQFNNLASGGRMIVTFAKLKEMVDMGYNIINAQYLNKDMIEIEFEYYREENMRKGRI